MSQALRVVGSKAPADALIAYFTDAGPVFAEARPFLARHHRDGEAFAAEVADAGQEVLALAARLDTERAEAHAATAAQEQVRRDATANVRFLRRYAAFVAAELQRQGDPDGRGRRLSTALGVGGEADFRRMSGLRRVLLAAQAGLAEVTDVLAAWPPPLDFTTTIPAALAALDAAIRDQSREALEADLAQDRLDVALAAAVGRVNRGLRLLATYEPVIPAELLGRLRALEGDHPAAFGARPTSPGATSPAVDPAPPLDPEPEAEPDTLS